MCIRDRYQRRVRGTISCKMGKATPKSNTVSRTSILSHVARYDRSNLEDTTTIVLSYRSIGPEVTSLKQLGPRKRLAEVETIFLDHNSLRKFEPEQTIRTLRELYLDHNYLKEIDGANAMLSQLETLSLTSNRITSISNMAGFKRLRVLRLGNNRLSSLSGLVGGACSNTLDTLVLSHNNIAHQYQLSELANFPMLSVLDLRGNPIGASPEIMKFCLLCCPNLKMFNGQKVTDEDVISASDWGSANARGRSVYCLIEAIREMEGLAREAHKRSSTGLLRSDFIAYLSTFDDASACGTAVAADQFIRTSPDILSFQDPEFLCEQDRDIIRKERMLAQWDAKVQQDREDGLYDDEPVEQYDEMQYDDMQDDDMQYSQPQSDPRSDPSPPAHSGRFIAPGNQPQAHISNGQARQAPAGRLAVEKPAYEGEVSVDGEVVMTVGGEHELQEQGEPADDRPHMTVDLQTHPNVDGRPQMTLDVETKTPAVNKPAEAQIQSNAEVNMAAGNGEEVVPEGGEYGEEELHQVEEEERGGYRPEDLARESVFASRNQQVDEEGDEDRADNSTYIKSPEGKDEDAQAAHVKQYGEKIRKIRQDQIQKDTKEKSGKSGGIGILPRRERILNVRYMTNTCLLYTSPSPRDS
eukprot:TRINITY_DN992_c0_g1_i3.p1 TRINITY_DN992_c0_g1~~TRINITY_DN992_c0_g1_i3.p1  ORF type:complete len:638 (+),score=171.11 TRINITY_DN992_c0_g1_i3:153-2066(+)